MKYISLVAVVILFAANCLAQTGKLILEVSPPDDDTLPFKAVLLKNDSALSEKKISYPGYNVRFDSLASGTYQVNIYQGKELYQSHRSIQVRKDQEVTVTINLSPYYWDTTEDTLGPRQFMMGHLSYSPRILEPDTASPIQHLLSFGGGTQMVGKITHNFYMGFEMSCNVNWGLFDTSKTVMPPASHTTERMFGIDYTGGLLTKFTFYNGEKPGAHGLYLDLGADYNFPLMFRHVVINASQKIVNRHIHRFNNFSAVARLGWGYFTIQAQYRLTDYVKGIYPEMPRLLFGIGIGGSSE